MRAMVLGPLGISCHGKPVQLTGVLRRRLLTALIVQANTVVTADRLIDILWGEDAPASAPRNLHNLVWRVRSALDECGCGSVELITQSPGYQLRIDPDAIDTNRFEGMVAEATAATTDRPGWAVARLAEALELWRGPAFAEFSGEEFCRYEAMRLEELRLVATEERFEACLAMGAHAEVIGEIEAFAAEHPLRERPTRLRMDSLYRAGRQVDALTVYRRFRRQLVDQLGLEPSPTLRQCHQQILSGEWKPAGAAAAPDQTPATAPTPPATRHHQHGQAGNLPLELSELVGRATDIAMARVTLAHHRVVTMTGVGGVGKTRLALRVAAELQSSFPHGVWVCDLAAVREGWLVPDLLATTLGVQEPQGLSVLDGVVEFLRSRRVLLVVDSCEHVLDAAAHLVDMIARDCSEVTVLATSREPLGIDGEHILPVRPLAIPAPATRQNNDQVATVPSVALFVDRATATVPTFALTAHNVAAVIEICRRLDGLPLAIELAATRLGSMSAHEIAGRLERRMQFLHSTRRVREERHSTLEAVVAWSYHLLEPDERLVFDRLSVLVGMFSMDDAVAIARDEQIGPPGIVNAVTGLVHKSMLVADTSGARTRFAMLETLRIYGRDRLEQSGQAEVIRRRHAAYCIEVAESSVTGLAGPDEALIAERVTAMLDDLRSAHSWALATDPAAAIRLSAALLRYTSAHGPSEVYGWAERAATSIGQGDATADPGLSAALAIAAAGAARRGDLTRAADFAGRGLAVLPDPTDARRRFPLWVLARVASFEGRLADAAHLYEEVARLAESAGDVQCVAYVTASGALQHAYQGDSERAARLARRAGTLALPTGNPTAVAWADYALGVALQDVEPEHALAVLERARATARAGHNTYIPGVALSVSAGLLTRHGNPRQAVELAAKVMDHWSRESHWAQQWVALRIVVELLTRLCEFEAAAVIHGALRASRTAIQPTGADAESLRSAVTRSETQLGASRFAVGTARGSAMSDDEAVAFAMAAIHRLSREESLAVSVRAP